MEDKSSFLLYCDIIHMVIKLPDDKAGKLFKQLLEYVNDKNPETDDMIVQIAFEPIKQQIIHHNKCFFYMVLLRNKNETFIKVGISYNVRLRISEYKNYGYLVELLTKKEFKNKNESYIHEQYFIKNNMKLKYTPRVKFPGYTECFNINLLKKLNG